MYFFKHAWKRNTLHYIGDLVNEQYIQYDNTPDWDKGPSGSIKMK